MWLRYGRTGRPSLIEALDNPFTRDAYAERQAARDKQDKQDKQAYRDLMRTLACADYGNVPKEETTWEYGHRSERKWTRRPGGRCYPCHEKQKEREVAAALQQLERARAANAELRPCWTCRGSIGGKEGSRLELTEEAGPNRLECPQCVSDREEQELGPLVLPAPTKREQMAALVAKPADP